jgi:hypothetical protein
MVALDRQPDLVAKLNSILATPGAAGTYIDNNCVEYVVRGANDTKVVSDFLGHTPAQQPNADGALLCSDFEGIYHGFYKYAACLCCLLHCTATLRCNSIAFYAPHCSTALCGDSCFCLSLVVQCLVPMAECGVTSL